MTLKCLYIIKLTGFANKYVKPLSMSVGFLFVPFCVCVYVIVREGGKDPVIQIVLDYKDYLQQ